MSLGLLVDIRAAGVALRPLTDAATEPLGSKGSWECAPLIPKTMNPLYSPPYSELARPSMDSVTLSEDNRLGLLAQNSAIWSLSLPVVPSFLPDTVALISQESPAVSWTEKEQLV